MSYQDDLDWLARNVHEWPEHTPHVVTDGDSLFEFGAVFCKNHVRINMEDNSGKIFLKDRWVARRLELRVKAEPHSFTGLDEAIRKVLSVMRTEPEAFTPKELSEMKDICDAELAKLDTLEKRPDMNKNHEEIDTSAERVQKEDEFIGARQLFNDGEKAVIGAPHPNDFGIPKEHWESAKNYAEWFGQNKLAKMGIAGHKADHGKPIMGAIPPHAELAVARVLTFGAEKYARDGWQYVESAEVRYMDAALRHLNAHRRGELVDDESGEIHLAHAACCIMFLLDAQEREGGSNE